MERLFCRLFVAIHPQIIALVVPGSRLQKQAYWDFTKRQVVAKKAEKVALVGSREGLGPVAHQRDGWGLGGDLGGVEDLRAFELIEWRRLALDRVLNKAVELSRGDSLLRLLEEHLGMVDQRLDVLAGLASDEGDRAIGQQREFLS